MYSVGCRSDLDGFEVEGAERVDERRAERVQQLLQTRLHTGVPLSLKTAPLPRKSIGPQVKSYCRVLRGGFE